MIRSPQDRLFARFCRTGDPRALARLFDATAPELWRVAAYFLRDENLVADAVQGTFLKAVENASTWDSARPVLPWLIGILTNEVRTLRVRLHRALAHLRRLLPAGFAAGGVLLAHASAAPLAAMRRVVLARAPAMPVAMAAGAGLVGITLLGGLAMKKTAFVGGGCGGDRALRLVHLEWGCGASGAQRGVVAAGGDAGGDGRARGDSAGPYAGS